MDEINKLEKLKLFNPDASTTYNDLTIRSQETAQHKRLSGAQKRKIKKERAKNQEGEVQQSRTTKIKMPQVVKDNHFNSSKAETLHNDTLTAVIVPVDFPSVKLAKTQAELVRNSLARAIDAASADGYHLQFFDCMKINGALVVKCKSQFTLDWLKVTMSNITFENLHLTIIGPQDLPVYTKLIMWVPGSEDPINIFNSLECQNEGLKTKGWHLINKKNDRNGQTLVVSVDESTMEVLRQIDYRPFLGLGRIKLTTLKKVKVGQQQTGDSLQTTVTL